MVVSERRRERWSASTELMTRIVFGVFLIAAVFFQATILPQINPLAVSPNIPLVMLFTWSALRGTREALIWVFLTGILLDVLSLDPFGTNALALLIVVALAGPTRSRMFTSNLMVPIALVIVATLVHGLVLYTLRGITPNVFIVLQALLHALLMPLVYIFVRYLDR